MPTSHLQKFYTANFLTALQLVDLLSRSGADPNLPDKANWTPLMSAVVSGSSETVQSVISAGAILNALSSDGKTALDYGVRDKLKSIAVRLREAGAVTAEELSQPLESSTGKVERPVFRESLSAIETPDLTAVTVELSKLVGAETIRSAEIPGGIFFRISEEDRKRLVQQLHDPFLKRGLYVFASNHHLGVYPTTDRYEVLRAMGTNGTNYQISTEKIISELKAIDVEQPFVLHGVGRDFVSGEFTTPLKNARALAKRLYKLCPDIVDQGAGTLAAAATEIKRTRQFFLWWD